jgi:hypothetical protein
MTVLDFWRRGSLRPTGPAQRDWRARNILNSLRAAVATSSVATRREKTGCQQEFYPTYDYRLLAEQERKRRNEPLKEASTWPIATATKLVRSKRLELSASARSPRTLPTRNTSKIWTGKTPRRDSPQPDSPAQPRSRSHKRSRARVRSRTPQAARLIRCHGSSKATPHSDGFRTCPPRLSFGRCWGETINRARGA